MAPQKSEGLSEYIRKAVYFAVDSLVLLHKSYTRRCMTELSFYMNC